MQDYTKNTNLTDDEKLKIKNLKIVRNAFWFSALLMPIVGYIIKTNLLSDKTDTGTLVFWSFCALSIVELVTSFLVFGKMIQNLENKKI